MGIEIITNPNNQKIDKDIKKADILAVIHGQLNREEIELAIKKFRHDKNYRICYVHYYTEGKNYTIGLKRV